MTQHATDSESTLAAVSASRPRASDYSDAGPIATTEEFKAALLATRDWIGISPTQLQMLQAQCRAPDATISAAQLAEQLKFKNFAAARLQYGTLARAVAEKLGYAPPQKGKAPVRWWFALSIGQDGPDDSGDGQFKWIMRPELVAALRAMRWA
ncbi:MAG: hypothetical protein E6H78_03740 [Betaproteobacteria bacterium]|nr:MAG: hypothetical protein E6H78_03740 [Betaproteobacteria bacterium]